mmetsp:Transcript_60136/g.135977  ORF Transcript_60136/g.135977 Transcript_60136/m.135977 type:complete len:494 (-) Transcript_60136:267-1748(-)|eukprot:CAMPEP_0172617092 /NCGR_PEP_ID=MMETSP1068-20121228/70028_1 /TAXON_ID=35684 /ORGANISM="Pseudopedinella elastica, Strain CCMP716" /LENGTH=493 /DNA_ID=CAMNT_0013422761 /DNA_START=123 /DNA_END=1604 /DNA_ORIENTATION=-
MPPKKGKKGKAKGPEEPKTDFDEHTSEMLIELIPRMTEQLKDLTNQRNYHQLDRDAIDGFRNLSLAEVTKLDNESSMKDVELADLIENHRVELEVYAHKVRHLKYETDVDVTKVRTDTDKVLAENHETYRAKVERAEKGKVAALGELDDQLEVTHDAVAYLKTQQDLELAQVTAKHQATLEAYERTCSERLSLLRANLDVQQRVELQEIEDRKNAHLQTLMANHDEAFKEMKEYYQGITQDNCGLIKRYDEELSELRANHARNLDLKKAAQAENERLREPLGVVMAEVASLRASLSEVDKIKLMLRNARGRLRDGGRRRDAGKREVDRLKRQLARCDSRREALYKEFETSILELQSKTDRKNLLLAKRLDGYEAEAEGCEAKIEQMSAAMELDRGAVLNVLRGTAAAVKDADEDTDSLGFEIARGVKVYNETLAALQERMKALGVPEHEADDFGFEKLPMPEGGARTQPSGLVAAPFDKTERRTALLKTGGGF